MSTDSPLKKAMPWLSKLEEFPFKEKEKGGSGKSNIISTVVDMTMDKEDGGMNENDIPAHTMLKILKEKVKQIQDERTIARKNKKVTEAKSKTDIIEKYMKIITEIEDEQPAVISLDFTADIVGFPTLWNKTLPEPNIDISVLGKPTHNTVRKINKSRRNWCEYCKEYQTKISRHFVSKHSNENYIKEYISINPSDLKEKIKKRREFCKKIISNFNNIHNERIKNKVLSGPLIPMKASKTDVSEQSHLVCTSCGGLFSKHHFSSHKNYCIKTESLITKEPPTEIKSSFLHQKIDDKYNLLKDTIFTYMNKDEIGFLAQTDPLILEYGRRFLNGHRHDNQKKYVSTKMRTLAMLLLRLKKADPVKITSMEDCINPKNFDLMCNKVKEWSRFDDKKGTCLNGSVPTRLCKSLKKCSDILRSNANKNANLSQNEVELILANHKKFIELMEDDWRDELNAISDNSLKKIKMTKEDKLPSNEDVSKFFDKMISKIEKLTSSKKAINILNHQELCKALIAFLIAFNGRRPTEVTYATTTNFASLKTQMEDESEISVFYVTATKNDIRVPIILPHGSKNALVFLERMRKELKISGDLLFPKENGRAFNGGELLSKFVNEIGLKVPSHFTANGLRHYWATVSTTDAEMKSHMPKVLGHTLAIHKKFYELPSSEVHLNIIGPKMASMVKESESDKTRKTTTHGQQQLDLPGSSEQINLNSNSQVKRNVKHKLFSEQTAPVENVLETKGGTVKRKRTEDGKGSRKKPCTLRPRKNVTKTNSELNLILSDQESTDSCDDSDADPNYKYPTPIISNVYEKEIDSSSDDSNLSMEIKKRQNWITPEKKELFHAIPKSILGIQRPVRGEVANIYKNSKLIKKRHSLQTTRDEISKYFTKRKVLPSPIQKTLQEIVDGTLSE